MADINVISPEGVTGTIPEANLSKALALGYIQETAQQGAVREYVAENDGVKGAAKVFFGQALDEFAMGIPELIADSTQDPYEAAKREALKKEHSYANTAGGVLGFAGSLAYGAPIGKLAVGLGERLAANAIKQSAGQISAGVAKKAAGSIATKAAVKIAGGAAEGAAFAAPRAITEASLGDWEAGAESLASGALLGGAISGVIGGSVVGARKLKEFLPTKDSIKPLVEKASRVFLGVPTEYIEKYLLNPKAIDDIGERGVIGVKGDIDTAVDIIDSRLSVAKDNFKNTEAAYKNNIRAARSGLEKAKQTVDLDDLNLLASELDGAKATLKADSDAALDILVDSNTTVPRPKMLAFLTQLKTDLRLPARAGKEAIELTPDVRTAVADLDAMRAQVAKMEKEIDPTTAKTMLKQLDGYINRPKAAGAFFEDLTDRQLSSFRGFIDSFLKENEQYKAAMAPLAEKAKLLGELSRAAGTPNKAKSFFIAAGDPQKNKIQAKLLSDFDEMFQTNFGKVVSERRRGIALLDKHRAGGTNADRLLTAGLRDTDQALLAEYDAAKAALDVATDQQKSISGLSRRQTQNVVERAVLKIEAGKELERLAVLTGQADSQYFRDMVENYRVFNSFEKSSTQGSRKVVAFREAVGGAGALVGSIFGPGGAAVGGVAGGIAGAGAGAVMDIYGGAVLKAALKNNTVKGLLFAERAMKDTANQIDRLDVFLNDLASGKHKFAESALIAGAVRFTGNRKAKAQQLEKLSDTLSKLSSDPQAMQNRAGVYTGPIAESGAPNTAAAMSQTMALAIQYLQKSIPKAGAPQSAFAKKFDFLPSDSELADFEQRLEVVQDPFVVLAHFANGSLTPSHTDALQKVYPKILNALKQKINKIGSDGKAKPLTYKNRVKLSMLLGEPIDESLNSINFFQQSFVGEDKSIDPAIKANVNIAEGEKTEAQRLA